MNNLKVIFFLQCLNEITYEFVICQKYRYRWNSWEHLSLFFQSINSIFSPSSTVGSHSTRHFFYDLTIGRFAMRLSLGNWKVSSIRKHRWRSLRAPFAEVTKSGRDELFGSAFLRIRRCQWLLLAKDEISKLF